MSVPEMWKRLFLFSYQRARLVGWTAVSSDPQLVSLHTTAHKIRIHRSVVGICEYIDLAASLPELR